MEHESNTTIELTTPIEEGGCSNINEDHPVGFSLAWTIICTALVAAGMGLLVWSYDSLTSIEHVENPERALAHIVTRSMDLESLHEQAPPWQQSLYQILNGDEDPSTPLIGWYDELTNTSSDPLSSLYAALLEAEAGELEGLNVRIESWDERSEPFPLFQTMLTTAYGVQTSSVEDMTMLQARLAEEVPDNWFYSRLALQLAKRADDVSLESRIHDAIETRVNLLFWQDRVLVLTEMSLAVLGGLALLLMMWFRYQKGSGVLMMSHASLPPPWFGRDGFAVLMRGGAFTLLLLSGLGVLLGAYFSVIDGAVDSKIMELISSILLYAPIPFLLYYYLLQPKGLSLSEVLGLHVRAGKVGMLVLTVLALFACGMFGDVVISLGGKALGRATHWTEWFNDSLVWGGTSGIIILFLEVAVLAPIFEECIFRGIVFGSLRRRFGWVVSAMLSAAIFSIVHGYGLVGFVAVWWSGFLWAWAYEKTGSLWPGILAHALNNLVLLLSLLLVFR